MNSKERDQYYGVKPRNVEHKAEELPKSPARKPYPGYCKRLKGEHVFSLFDVKVYPQYCYPGGWGSRECFIKGLIHYKEYRCDACGKKNIVREEFKLDEPVRKERLIA